MSFRVRTLLHRSVRVRMCGLVPVFNADIQYTCRIYSAITCTPFTAILAMVLVAQRENTGYNATHSGSSATHAKIFITILSLLTL